MLPPSTGPRESDYQLIGFSSGFKIKDSAEINRFLGFLEYQQALDRLDTLARTCTPNELAGFDSIVRQRPEFAVYSNLARDLPLGNTTLQIEPKRTGDDFKRHGLRWMMALARVELGAMLAVQTELPDPFWSLVRTDYDREVFRGRPSNSLFSRVQQFPAPAIGPRFTK